MSTDRAAMAGAFIRRVMPMTLGTGLQPGRPPAEPTVGYLRRGRGPVLPRQVSGRQRCDP
ncbi:hypothetical protein GCM10022205_02450 [Spinactinospora alkalitolerans]